MLVRESSEGGYSVEFPCGTTARRKEGGKEGRRKGRILVAWRDREREKVWTMTQGHEPHGDEGGREGGRQELLIRACGISYGYHRTDSVLPPMAATGPLSPPQAAAETPTGSVGSSAENRAGV